MKKPRRKRIKIYNELKRLKKIRDEILLTKNIGRKKYLLFKLGVISFYELLEGAECSISGGWTFRVYDDTDYIDKLALQVYRFFVENIIKEIKMMRRQRNENGYRFNAKNKRRDK